MQSLSFQSEFFSSPVLYQSKFIYKLGRFLKKTITEKTEAGQELVLMRQVCYPKEFIVFLIDLEFCRSVNDGLGRGN